MLADLRLFDQRDAGDQCFDSRGIVAYEWSTVNTMGELI